MVEYTLVPEDEFKFQGKLRGRATGLYIWVVQPTGEVAFRQVDLNREDLQLKDLIQFSRNAFGVRSRGGFEPVLSEGPTETEQLQKLHQLLIEPIIDLLPADEDDLVVFIPQEGLFMVPFPALKDANGQYLIQQHTILTAPAIQMLDLTRIQRERLEVNGHMASGQAASTALQKDDLLIVGNPEMPNVWVSSDEPDRQLASLPGAEQEALAIAKFFDTQALTNSEATETTLKQQMPDARVIHLATHGLLEYGQPKDSGVQDVPGAIALTPGDGEDGLLTANEIQNLSLNAELVVLSACNTGLGEITGDGVIGLSRSLITAGAPSVIVSLWAVPDAPTAELMTEFYRQWRSGLDKAQALRRAMLVTMETHPEPRDWAVFTLIGEAK
ncbi:MAG: CHAT domain-containing protein [Pseudanabaenales cyanobacterium]|nr:CHAT domain-containing protein [Pseudanabaenales cyanobacterium]